MDSSKNIKFIYLVIKIQNYGRQLPEIIKAYSADRLCRYLYMYIYVNDLFSEYMSMDMYGQSILIYAQSHWW